MTAWKGIDQKACRVFNVVTAYEDCTDGIRAKEMLNRLAARLGPDLAMTSDLWGFDALGLPPFSEMADTAAAAADVIIICAQKQTALPTPVKEWIAKWLPKQWGGLMVALLHGDQDPANELTLTPLGHGLKQMAEEANLDFFCQTDCWQQRGPDCTVGELLRQAETRSAVLERLLYRRVDAWV